MTAINDVRINFKPNAEHQALTSVHALVETRKVEARSSRGLEDLNELRTFRKIMKLGSLSAAARDMGLRLSVVSKRLAALERRIGQRLIHRTTRRLTPTDEGIDLLAYVERALAELEAAELHLASGSEEPTGVLRIGCPISIGRAHLAPVLAQLTARYPRLEVELQLEDWPIDLLSKRVDVAIYLGRLPDNSYVARKLADNERILVAAPDYLQRSAPVRSPSDLRSHACLRWHDGREPWQLDGPDDMHLELEVRSRLRSSSGDVIHQWCLDGRGIMFKSRIDLACDLASGRLVQVLPAWRADAPVCALLPTRRHLTPRIRVFLDALGTRLEEFSE